jgi:hypothetical protein
MPSDNESALRSRAKRQGYVIHKSRKRVRLTPNDLGKFMVLDNRNSCRLGSRYDATLEQVAKFLES